MKIADVFNERSKEYYRQENSSEYAYITADEYTAAEVISMEKQILNILNFDLYSPTAIAFIKLYNSVLKVNTKVLLCACYLADLMLLPTLSNKYNPSLIASASLFVAHSATNHSIEVFLKNV